MCDSSLPASNQPTHRQLHAMPSFIINGIELLPRVAYCMDSHGSLPLTQLPYCLCRPCKQMLLHLQAPRLQHRNLYHHQQASNSCVIQVVRPRHRALTGLQAGSSNSPLTPLAELNSSLPCMTGCPRLLIGFKTHLSLLLCVLCPRSQHARLFLQPRCLWQPCCDQVCSQQLQPRPQEAA
jgi:hypothetical protein